MEEDLALEAPVDALGPDDTLASPEAEQEEALGQGLQEEEDLPPGDAPEPELPADQFEDDADHRGELLLAVLGIRGFLAREHERATVGDRMRARRLPRVIADEVRAFIAQEPTQRGPGRPSIVRAFPYFEILHQLAQPVGIRDIQEFVGSHRHGQDAVDVLIPLTKAIAFLNGAAPRRQRQTLMSTEPVKPSEQEVSRFRRIFAAVDEPMTLFRRLRQGVLLADEVAAVASVYPSLYETIQEEVGKAIARTLERNPKFKSSRRTEWLLRTLIGQGPSDPKLVQDLQANYPQEGQEQQAPAPSSSGKLKISGKSFSSAGQRAENGGR